MAGDADEPISIPIERELDLHAFRPRDIPAVVAEYLTAAQAAGLTEVRLVHGRGRGVQRGIVQAALDRHPAVESFATTTRPTSARRWRGCAPPRHPDRVA